MNEPARIKSVRYPVTLLAFIERHAREQRRTFSFVVVDVLEQWRAFLEAKKKAEK